MRVHHSILFLLAMLWPSLARPSSNVSLGLFSGTGKTGSSSGSSSEGWRGPKEKSENWAINVGVHASPTYFYPTIQIQRRIWKHLVLGFMPFSFSYQQDNTQGNSQGGFLTLSLFSGRGPYGFWIQGGVGRYWFHTTVDGVSESDQAGAWMTTVGWRGKWGRFLNIGFGGGVLDVNAIQSNLVDLHFSGLMPLVVFDIGIVF